MLSISELSPCCLLYTSSTKNIQSAGSELALSVEQEEDNITAIVDNNSAFDTTAALTLKAGDASGKVLKTINLGNVESYDTVEKTFTKEELKKLGSDTVYMLSLIHI